MNRESLLGIVRHLLTVAGGGLVTSGSLTSSEMEQGVGALLTLAGIGWSLWAKRRQPAAGQAGPPETPPSTLAPVLVGCALFAGLMLAGCAGSGGGVALNSEKALTTSFNTVDTFLAWEHANRDVLSDQVTAVADTLRTTYPPAHDGALQALAAYKQARDASSHDALLTWLATLQGMADAAMEARARIATP
ncbi:MAG: hypothetical protein KF791_08440 [Verrucomicrobiae bacterium]|nr:hypothetical protein [Verrucomicrobiae bacterium]